MNVGEFLKKYRLIKKLSGRELAEEIGVDKMRLQKWEAGKGSPKTEDSEKIKDYFGIKELDNISDKLLNEIIWRPTKPRINSQNEETELTDDLSATNKALKYRVSLKENKRPVPVMNVKAAAGTIAIVQDEPELIVEYLDVPFVGMVDGAIEIVGESMLPTLSPGARAAVRRLEDKRLLIWGEVYYVVDSNYEGYVKRLYPGSDDTHITLRSDNDELYPPVTRKWENIVAIFKVKANITKH